MIYLLLSIACYVTTSVTMKLAAQRNLDSVGVNLMVRVSGVILTAVLVAAAGATLWHQPQLGLAGLIGLAAGLCTFLSGYSGLRALEVGSLNATWSLMRVATIMPVLASIIFFGELRGVHDWREIVPKVSGIIFLMIALVLLGRGRHD
ncbi:MAG: hypothetical protein ACM3VW_10490 [Bacteroidota bacterium]